MSRRTDPTGTATIQREYAQSMRGLLGRVNSEARDRIVGDDVIGLRGDTRETIQRTNVSAFLDWFRDAVQARRRQKFGTERNRWLQSGYIRGLRDADTALREAGFDVEDVADPEDSVERRPHRGVLKSLYSRAAREWRGLVEATAQAIGRELADAVRRGDSPSEAARAVSDRVQHVGKYRATKLAQTEVVRAHANATLERYKQAGVERVGAQVEYQTAEDDDVCEKCEPLDGDTYTVDDAFGEIPQHPGCRCRWWPVEKSEATARALSTPREAELAA